MKMIFMMLLAISLPVLAIAGEVQVQDPALTITGHYRSRDGRVNEHKFPVEIKLLADGKFTGTFESWIEARLTDGSSELDYRQQPFSGTWKIKGETIRITVIEAGFLLPQMKFKKFNGLQVKIERQKSPNK